jgi:hypothetical protein
MTGDRYEPNRFLGFPISRDPAARQGESRDPKSRQGEESQRVMGIPVDWFSSLDHDNEGFQPLAHPIRRFGGWLRRRRSGPYLMDEDDSRPGG